jgi:hypothetical protein
MADPDSTPDDPHPPENLRLDLRASTLLSSSVGALLHIASCLSLLLLTLRHTEGGGALRISPIARRHGSRRDTLDDSSPSSSGSSAGLQSRQNSWPSLSRSNNQRLDTFPDGQRARVSARGKQPVNLPPPVGPQPQPRRSSSHVSQSHRQSQSPQRSASYSAVSTHLQVDGESGAPARTGESSGAITYPHTGKHDRPLLEHHNHNRSIRRRTQSQNDPEASVATPLVRPNEPRASRRSRPLVAVDLLSQSARNQTTSSSTMRNQDQPSLQALLQEVDVASALQLVKSVQLQTALSQSHNQQPVTPTIAAHFSQPPRSLSPDSAQTGQASSTGETSVRPLLKNRENEEPGYRKQGDDGVHKKDIERLPKDKEKSRVWHFPGFGAKAKRERDVDEAANEHARSVPGLQHTQRVVEGERCDFTVDFSRRSDRLLFASE